jgi:hypothetical protein
MRGVADSVAIATLVLAAILFFAERQLADIRCREGFVAVHSATVLGFGARPVCVSGYKP